MSTELQIANMAFSEVGAFQLDSLLSERSDINLQNLFDQTRDELLEEHPWKFSLERTRLTAVGTLDCSAIDVTFDNVLGTIVRSTGSFVTDGFLDKDRVQVAGSSDNNSAYALDTAVALTLTPESYESLTDEFLSNSGDLKLYASPAYNWAYKYEIPSDCLAMWKVEEITSEGQTDPAWDREGDYIVSDLIDSTDQINAEYILQQDDTTKWNPLFVKSHYLRLASKLAIPVAQDKDLQATLLARSDAAVSLAKKRNAIKGITNLARKDTGWQSAVSS